MTPSIMQAGVELDRAVEALTQAWRGHAIGLALARDEARQRADKLSQILVGAAGLADEVLREQGRDEDHAYALAKQVADAIAKLWGRSAPTCRGPGVGDAPGLFAPRRLARFGPWSFSARVSGCGLRSARDVWYHLGTGDERAAHRQGHR